MPADHRVGLDEDQDISPARPRTEEHHPEQPICGFQAGPRPPGRESDELLVKGKVLEQEVGARGKEGAHPAGEYGEVSEHLGTMRAGGGAVNAEPAPPTPGVVSEPVTRWNSRGRDFWRSTATLRRAFPRGLRSPLTWSTLPGSLSAQTSAQ